LKTLLQGEGLVLAGVSVGVGGGAGAGGGQSDASSSSSRQGGDATSGIRRLGSRTASTQVSDGPATVVRRSVSTSRTLDLFV